MDSNIESQSPDNADRKPSFRKSANDKPSRKYRRHSSASGSDSSSLEGSPKHGRSPSPDLSREDPARISDIHLKRKNGGRELDMGRSRFDKGGDSHKRSDRRSYRSSSDYHRHGDYDRYHKRADERYHRSSGSGRELSTRSDRTRQGSERDRLGDYRRNIDKYAQEKSDDEERRGKDRNKEERKKHRDKDPTMERVTSGTKHTGSYVDDSKSGEWDRHSKDDGHQDDMRRYGKNLGDHNSDKTTSVEEVSGHGRHSNAGKESGGSRLKETQKSNIKDLGWQKGETMEKRKHNDRESDRHKEKFSSEMDGRDYTTSSDRKSYEWSEQHQDKPTRINDDHESSPKKFKVFNVDTGKTNGKDGEILPKSTVSTDERPPPRSKLPRETIDKVIPEPAETSNEEAEASHDLNAAKVAAMKAAELVNRNLVGGAYMSTDQKKKLLWGSKKNTVAEEAGHRWDATLFPDRERQEKFNKLMGVKGNVKAEHKPVNKDGSGLLQADKQEQLQMDLEKQYTAGLRRRDGRTVGLGL